MGKQLRSTACGDNGCALLRPQQWAQLCRLAVWQLLFEGACASWILVFCVPHSYFALTGWTGNRPQNKKILCITIAMDPFSKILNIVIAMDSLSKKTSVSPSPWTLCQKKTSASPSPWVNCQKILPLPWALGTAQLPGADRPKLAIGQWYLSLWDCLALTDQNVYHKKNDGDTCDNLFLLKMAQKKWNQKRSNNYSWQFVSAEIGGKNSDTKKVFTITCFGRNWRVSDAKKRPDSWSQFSAKSSGCHPTFFCTLRSPGFRRNWRISIEKTQN